MDTGVDDRWRALTEKEKQTLRLIVRGHDAKSTARSLGLSVHTINERLRDARRKMAVSSTPPAARRLMDAETPDLSGDAEIGGDFPIAGRDQGFTPISGAGAALRRPSILTGVLAMTFALSLLALLAGSQASPSPPPAAPTDAPNAEVVESARQWLVLVDQGRWDDSYRGTGSAFRALNTAEVWARVSTKVRTPLGAMVSRTFVSQENLPAPPRGYEVVKFRTRFANKAEAIETVTLDREDGAWRVVGITVG